MPWILLLLITAVGCRDNTVVVDVRHEVVKGYSPFVQFPAVKPFPSRPSSNQTKQCDSQALIQINPPTGITSAVEIIGYFHKPRRWSFHISDCSEAHGDMMASCSQLVLLNKQLQLQGQGELRHVVDSVLSRRSRLLVKIEDGSVLVGRGSRHHKFTSSGMFHQNRSLYIGINRVVSGNWRSGSGVCKAVIRLELQGDYCQNGDRHCDPNAICKERRNSFRCVCNQGFTGNGRTCEDFNECLIGNGGCVHTCNNSFGSYECQCKKGFVSDLIDPHNCLDEDECLNDESCQQLCVNTFGSYRCACKDGYSLMPDGLSCYPANGYCKHKCEHICEDSLSLPCSCLRGYKLNYTDLTSCLPTCTIGNGGCQHYCSEDENGSQCSCKENYRLADDGRTCLATCAVHNGGCAQNCLDVPDGVNCSCPNGLQLLSDGRSCKDQDECMVENGGCSYRCVNNIGSYECICPNGYKLLPDEKTCHDIDECVFNGTCQHFCHNTLGSYICTCQDGFQGYGGRSCGDIDECVEDKELCQHECVNTHGSYRCKCRDGFRLHQNGYDCVDATRCSPLQSPVKAIINCSTHYEGYIEETCQIRCQTNARFPGFEPHLLTATCGARTRYQWTVEGGAPVGAFLGCSETTYPAGYQRLFRITVLATEPCSKVNETHHKMQHIFLKLFDKKGAKWCREDVCQSRVEQVLCRQPAKIRKNYVSMMHIYLQVKVTSVPLYIQCNDLCIRQKTRKSLRRVQKNLRKIVRNGRLFRKNHRRFRLKRKSLKVQKKFEPACPAGSVLTGSTCVACSVGSLWSSEHGHCVTCPRENYQDQEGQLACKPCYERQKRQIPVDNCGGPCSPGYFSSTGMEPCQACPIGSYQPHLSRTSCIQCEGNGTTEQEASVRCVGYVICDAGQRRTNGVCEDCDLGYYQPVRGQNFCFKCPGDSITESTASTTVEQCKKKSCSQNLGQYWGYLESPNHPSDYPRNSRCTWKLRPGKGRRILLIIPKIDLGSPECMDRIVIRKSRSERSLTTFETCSSSTEPIVLAARSKKLWIRFNARGNVTGTGFQISYVTYNEDYQQLMEDIVQDPKLLEPVNHRRIFTDRQLMSSLMEVIAHPINYYKYSGDQKKMLPDSFIRYVTPKVQDFFTYK